MRKGEVPGGIYIFGGDRTTTAISRRLCDAAEVLDKLDNIIIYIQTTENRIAVPVAAITIRQ